MSTKYPILDNRPIDQWRVTELKDELKRRKITTKGLKEDLVKRLNEAICDEMESVKEADNGSDSHFEPQVESEDAEIKPKEMESVKEADNGLDCHFEPQVESEDAEIKPKEMESVKEADNGSDSHFEPQFEREDAEMESVKETETVADIGDLDDNNIQKVEDEEVDIDDSAAELDHGKVQDEEPMDGLDSVEVVSQPAALAVSVENNITVNEIAETQLASRVQEHQNSEIQLENEDPKAPREDAVPNMSDPKSQVSDVSPDLGFQVKCESISTDSVSINEKNELKDNLNADNVNLELEVVKPEMVQPSSSNVPPNDGDLHPLDGQEPYDNQGSIEDLDDSNCTNLDISKKIDSAEEKLNLDRSSGDDSMEDDVLEGKKIDPTHNSDEVENMTEPIGVHVLKKEIPIGDKGVGLSSDIKDEVAAENKHSLAVPSEKRKLEDQEVVGNNEPPKRQRRWNSEHIKVPEQTSNRTPSTTPKDAFQSTIPKRNFNRSDSTLSGDAPNERVVPPSPKSPTNSLRIDRFVRPFTLKAVQELLAKTGKIGSFWMDHIKTHCYVTYSSVDEAVETRKALYNLQWPTNGGRLLVAEFVDPQEVKKRAEVPQSPATPATISPTAPAPAPNPPSRQNVLRQQLPSPPPLPLPPPPPLSDPPPVRERLPLPPPPPPPLPKKQEPPIVTLDDLFRKTKALPRIYYLPLSEEQVAAKRATRGKKTSN